ncbi:hypothetical protein G6F57_010842 [Rhizopus arrhizus]|uniref:Uncharacterized protein n=1 Tax=Rhizopus oryzae TaxID=64495 RepID=A0A9P7BPY3_RHIOR|nr:hypothetical protein G6F23_008588 [Rhizopus arrhizus]KAG1413652.1 hypothetical protein G6F58_007370 [Rhizopus delemar]KAG0757000.1 hypothetical protein G6F24_010777 [Rhizopus arrhizus]KAG0784698.1 hypothetical protein G6F21_009742 [Rhizopus arrhizus]KAG0784948.1 hypothetical protein G6F22_008127 [Rhizopus arrhizus]
MHTTSEHNIHCSRQGKLPYSKVWKAGRSPGSVLLDMKSRSESPAQLMSLIAKQHTSRITVATIKEGSPKIVEINFDPSNPTIECNSTTVLPSTMIKSSLCLTKL